MVGIQSAAVKNGGGGSWFPVSHGKDTGETYGTNPVRGAGVDGIKVPGQKNGEEYAFTRGPVGVKVASEIGRRADVGKGARFTSRDCGDEGIKQAGLSGPAWFDRGAAHLSSKLSARKAASAAIAKIPYDLAHFIGQVYYPQGGTTRQHSSVQSGSWITA